MKNVYRTAIASTAAAVCAALLLAQNQEPQDEKAKAKAARKAQDVARIFEQNARTFTLFDRQGKMLNSIGTRAMYGNPAFSPDGKRVVYGKADLDKEVNDLFVMDLAGGNPKQLTAGKSREFVTSTPVWSPDGSQIAYTALRDGTFSVYRRSVSGEGSEELVYKLPGITAVTDWSQDGRYLALSSTDLGGGILSALPMTGSGEKKLIEVFKSPKQLQGGKLSPDGKLLAYLSNETGKNEAYVRPFDPGGSGAAAGPWKISENGALGMTSWRKDGKEFYFMAADRTVMVVPVTMSPSVNFGKATVLFRPAAEAAANPGTTTISSDGERILLGVPPPQLRQLTIYDRQGKMVRTASEPNQFITQAHFSPDGSKLVYMKQDPKTSDIDIWTTDLESGKDYPVTRDNWPENAPIWAPDGKRVMYASTRDSYAGIYRKNWDGTGEEELLFRYTPGAGIILTDSSPDGKFLTFYTGVLLMVPLTGTDPLARKAIDWLRDEFDDVAGRFSPDGRYIAYASNPDDPMALDVFVRPFDGNKPDAPPPGDPVQVTKGNIASGLVNWRGDGKELFYMTRDFEMMAVDVSTTPKFTAGTPKLLFKLPTQPVGNPLQWKNVSSDGQRFVFSMPAR